MIPETAIQAAAEALAVSWNDATEYDARAALEAALPCLEAALRKQIANDLQEQILPNDESDVAVWVRKRAADIAEEGNTK